MLPGRSDGGSTILFEPTCCGSVWAMTTVFTPASSLISSLMLAACLSLGLSSEAAAAPPAADAGPEEEACGGRSIGDACSLPNRQLGTCKAGTCNRLDYSGGSPPKAIEQACVVCQPGAAHGGPPSLGSGGAPPDSGGGDDGGDDAGEPARTSSSSGSTSGKEPPRSSSRCRVDPGAGGLGTLGLFGLLGLLGLRGIALRRPGPPRP